MAVVPESERNKDFFKQVYEVVKLVPKGRVTSYGAIGKYLGAARSARMVGWAMNGCHKHDPSIPAHRVVNRAGVLSGKHHFPEPSIMEEKLAAEGVVVKGDQIQNFDKIFWDPTVELSL